jgi:hypothetical protein
MQQDVFILMRYFERIGDRIAFQDELCAPALDTKGLGLLTYEGVECSDGLGQLRRADLGSSE